MLNKKDVALTAKQSEFFTESLRLASQAITEEGEFSDKVVMAKTITPFWENFLRNSIPEEEWGLLKTLSLAQKIDYTEAKYSKIFSFKTFFCCALEPVFKKLALTQK
jgi:hypothetical protein